MAQVTDYVVVRDNEFLGTHGLPFNVPDNAVLSGTAILTYHLLEIYGSSPTAYFVAVNGLPAVLSQLLQPRIWNATVTETFAASRLHHGSNQIDFSLGGTTGNFRISDVVIWFQSEPVNSPTVEITNAGDIFLGGNGRNGDIVLRSTSGGTRIRLAAGGASIWAGGTSEAGDLLLFRPDLPNDTADNATVRLFGGGGDGRFGGNGSSGKLSIYPNHVVAGGFTDAATSILLDGYNAKVTIGGGGKGEIAASRDGEVVVLGTASQRVGVNLEGGSGNIAAEGDITAKGKVNASAFVANSVTLNVPDHVLHGDYPLMPIDELRTFVEREHHLPNVPNADQVRREGVDLARFQMLLLEKVEELTRYLLVQQATIDEQRSRLEALEQRR